MKQTINRETLDRDSLRQSVIEYIEARDQRQNHVHLRVTAAGEPYIDEDTSYTVSPDEYFSREGATQTVLHQQGWGTCDLADDWTSTDAGIEEIEELTERMLNRVGLVNRISK